MGLSRIVPEINQNESESTHDKEQKWAFGNIEYYIWHTNA